MGSWIFILLMVVGASLSASIPSNEIVSIPSITLLDDLKGSSRLLDSKALTSARSNLKPVSQMECESDDDCQKHQYCYETHVCSECYDCGLYYRYPSTSGCVKSPQMCGPCIDGYQNEILSGGKVRDTCTRTPTLPPIPDFTGNIWNTPYMWPIAAFLCIGLLVTLAVFAVICRGFGKRWADKLNRTGNGSYQVYSLPSAPPLPSKDCEISRDWVEEPLVRDHERERIVNIQSVPFDTSQTSKCCSGDDEAAGLNQFYTQPPAGFQYNAAVGPSPPESEDDATIPSVWTPQPWTEGTLATSFSGLFSQDNNNNANNVNVTNNTPQHSAVQIFTPNSSFNDSDASSSSNSNSSTGSEGVSSGPHPSSSVGGPVHILVQGGLGQSSVQCSVMVNNIQINEY